MHMTVTLGLVVMLALVVEATAGFGATIVTVTLASHLVPLHEVLGAFLPVNLALSTYLVVRHRRAVDARVLVRRILPRMGAGLLLGMAAFRLRGQGWLEAAFAAFVVVLAAAELARALSPKARAAAARPLRPLVADAALVGAGAIHGLFACGGPLLVYVAGREIEDKGAFRATLSAVWVVLNLALLGSYVGEGLVSAGSLRTSAALVVPLVAGAVLGERLHGRLAPERFRVAVFALLLFAGAALLARSLAA